MIDYKLILILVLSIVLLYIYNKIEEIKGDIYELKKYNKENYVSFDKQNNDNASKELLQLFKTQNLGNIKKK